VADLLGVSSAFGIFAVTAALLTVAAIVTGILGVYPATWILIIGTLISLLVVVFSAYASAARERDARLAPPAQPARSISGTKTTEFEVAAPVIDDRDGSFTIIDDLGPPLPYQASA
jgi:hypothetical protein